ncbi:ABC transporter permease [Puia sp. P3]|uniref:ABC transporter permease n=1 Tax=Puia sp. P3 TaxID=3423952 RepID=UPI003D67E8DD
MFSNYFKTALRNLWKNKGFSAINIVGLAIGLSTCLLILIFVMDETGYDKYNENADRIYRLDGDIKFGGIISFWQLRRRRRAPRCCGIFPRSRRKRVFGCTGG